MNCEDTEVMDDMGGQMIRESTVADTEARGTVALQQHALTQLHMPGLGIEFGLELMRQRAERLEKLPSVAMEGQLPVGPLP